ncbi:hypothetical protein O0Q50_22390 [Priestia aryabhattai]|uniref:Uncharacterized protein n=1 Tax=Priestia aryabhattai TaxID=412384 RepID=A0AAX6NDC8_PRIAR|nr:hypothetical protein [Priestia aryabhattai]MDU9693933.1 hypothetical protein [Priestia aryabhattai]
MEKKSISEPMMTLKDKEKIRGIVSERRVQRNQEISNIEESFEKKISRLKESLNSRK